MKNLQYKLMLTLFIGYWLITLFFIMPNNPISINLMRGKEVFETNFFQRWAFFAPPPTFNERVYVVLMDKDSIQKNVFEIVEPILSSKSMKAPFNGQEQIFDYIFSSTISSLEQNLRTLQDIFNSAKLKGGVLISDSLNTENLLIEVEKSSDFKTLANYAKKLAINNRQDISKTSYQIQIVKNSIPQFVDKENKTIKSEIIFSSHFLKFE